MPAVSSSHALSATLVCSIDQPRRLTSAWGVSLCVHAIVVATAAVLLRDLPEFPPSAYRMDLVIQSSAGIADAHSASQSPTAAVTPAASAAARPHHEPAASQSRVAEPPPDSSPATIYQPLIQSTPVTRIERDIVSSTAILTSTPVTTSRPMEQRIESSPVANEVLAPTVQPSPHVIERSIEPTLTHVTQSTIAHQESPVAQGEPQAPSSTESTGSASSHSEHAPSSAQGNHTATAEPHSSSVDTTTRGAESGNSSVAAQTSEADSSDAHHAIIAMGHPPITRTIPARSDFGWLKDLLKRKIKSLQAYPRLAAMQGWEGKVVVHATIGDDGQLLSAVVAESSGFVSLDQDALSLMHRATPIHLQYELGQSHIDVYIPVLYHLDR
ncbi:MAG: TonB family protein [Nitrospira sp.]|nr:TonB family protein [Nitrospira sp.]